LTERLSGLSVHCLATVSDSIRVVTTEVAAECCCCCCCCTCANVMSLWHRSMRFAEHLHISPTARC